MILHFNEKKLRNCVLLFDIIKIELMGTFCAYVVYNMQG